MVVIVPEGKGLEHLLLEKQATVRLLVGLTPAGHKTGLHVSMDIIKKSQRSASETAFCPLQHKYNAVGLSKRHTVVVIPRTVCPLDGSTAPCGSTYPENARELCLRYEEHIRSSCLGKTSTYLSNTIMPNGGSKHKMRSIYSSVNRIFR